MKWLTVLRVVLMIMSIIKEVRAGTVTPAKVESVITQFVPEKYKAELNLLTPEDKLGIADVFLTLGTIFEDIKD